MTNQLFRILCLPAFALMAAFAQQTPISSIRVYTVPEGARFYVDGQLYYGSQTFLWPQGSKHIVQFPTVTVDGVVQNYQTSLDGGTKYTFGSWEDNRSLLATASSLYQTITADPTVTFLRANLSATFRISLRFSTAPTAVPGCDGAPGNPPQDSTRAGLIFFEGGPNTCYGSNADFFLPVGNYRVNAFPYPGWVFTGWYVNGQSYPSYLSQISILGPVTVAPVFQLGHRVQFVTDPPGLQVLIDRTPTPTSSADTVDNIYQPGRNVPPCSPGANLPPQAPAGTPNLCLGEFDFLPGSQHTIGGVTPQIDRSGKYWVFNKFSNNMAQNTIYVTPSNTSTKEVVTANFAAGVQVAFLTNPPGLKLQVDGTTNWQSYNFIWANGSTHTVTAPAAQVDTKGRKWSLQSWSNSSPGTQTIVADIKNNNVRYIANYGALGQVQITSNPPGVTLQVDGADCKTPCTLDREAGAKVAIAAPSSIPMDSASRLDFLGWNDGGTPGRVYEFGTNASALWVNYGTSYKLSAGSDPANGVDMTFDPPSTDGFFAGDVAVNVTAKAKPGFKFRRWGGDASGTYPLAQVTMDGPHAVLAMMDRTPYIAPAGIKNAAGDTPDGTVAPGSIIAIFGESLAPAYQVGPSSPLAQAIGDTVVTINDRFLPLLFVSPNQINAQVLSDLPDGDYTLRVQTTGLATVTGTFTISRNAPGLFANSTDTDSRKFSRATHQDGSAVTPDSPARRGETISILGTGFGPYDQKVIDGFIIPDAANYKLLDTVVLNAGDQTLQPVWSGAAPGYIGTTSTKFKIDDTFPAATNVELTVQVNGKPSNKVLLPVE